MNSLSRIVPPSSLRLSGKERTLLKLLLENGRISDVELGEKLGISSQAASQIRKKLVTQELITHYYVDLDLSLVGINVMAVALLDIPFNDEGVKIGFEQSANVIGFYKVIKQDISHIAFFGFRTLDELSEYFSAFTFACQITKHVKALYIFPSHNVHKNSPKGLFIKSIKEKSSESSIALPAFSNEVSRILKKEFIPLKMNEKELLKVIVKDARISNNKLSTQLELSGISGRAISNIRHRLESTGVINGYSVKLNYSQLGLNIFSFSLLRSMHPTFDASTAVSRWAQKSDSILGCYSLADDSRFLIYTGFRTIDELESYYQTVESELKDYLKLEYTYVIPAKGILKESCNDLIRISLN